MNDKLRVELAALRAKRRPTPTDAERKAKEEEAALMAELEAERARLRNEENEDIKAKHAPNAVRAFFDFDPDCLLPDTIEKNGVSHKLYTRFVVKGANADLLEAHSDAIVASVDKDGHIAASMDIGKQTAITAKCARECIVWPTAADMGVTDEQHKKNLDVSLLELGSARAELGKAALEIGTRGAAARNSKS